MWCHNFNVTSKKLLLEFSRFSLSFNWLMDLVLCKHGRKNNKMFFLEPRLIMYQWPWVRESPSMYLYVCLFGSSHLLNMLGVPVINGLSIRHSAKKSLTMSKDHLLSVPRRSLGVCIINKMKGKYLQNTLWCLCEDLTQNYEWYIWVIYIYIWVGENESIPLS